ncbi:MAG: hypothetical protein E7085_00885 [Parabacteroides distasonis]|nr:hypothetical protein [Parabacteroides distasonis]
MRYKQIQKFYQITILIVTTILVLIVFHIGYTDSLSALHTQVEEMLRETITIDIKKRSKVLTGDMTFGHSPKTATSSDTTIIISKDKEIKYTKDTTLSLQERRNLAILRILSLENPVNIDSLNYIFSQKATSIGLKGIFNFTIVKEQGDTLKNSNNYTNLTFAHQRHINIISAEQNQIILFSLYDPFYIFCQIKSFYWIIIGMTILLGILIIQLKSNIPKKNISTPITPTVIKTPKEDYYLYYKETHTFNLIKRKCYKNDSKILTAITISKGCHTRALAALLKEKSYSLPKEQFIQITWDTKQTNKISEQTLSTMLSRFNSSIEPIGLRLIKDYDTIKIEETKKL